MYGAGKRKVATLYTMHAYGALIGLSFTFRPLYPVEMARGTHWTEGWVNPTARQDALEMILNSFPYWESDSDFSDIQFIA